MRRAMPGCIAAISSTVSVPCFVVARTCAPGIGASSMVAAKASGSRTFRVSGPRLLDTDSTIARPLSSRRWLRGAFGMARGENVQLLAGSADDLEGIPCSARSRRHVAHSSDDADETEHV